MLKDKNSSCCSTGDNSCCDKTVCGCWCLGLLASPRFWVSVVIAFLVLCGFDWYWHGTLMMPLYDETSVMWRPAAEMKHSLFTIEHILTAIVYVFLLKAATRSPRWIESVFLGLMIGAPLAISCITWWNVMPFAVAKIPTYWAVGYLLQAVLVSLVLKAIGCLCKKFHKDKAAV